MKISKWKDRWKTQIPLPNGKYKSVYGKTKREVKEKANAVISEIEQGEWVEVNDSTVEGWFNSWVGTYLTHLKPATQKTYKQHVKNHIIPHFGKKKLQSVSNLDIQKFINKLSKKLSPKTIKNTYLVLHKGLSDAVKNNLIRQNPADNISLPKEQPKEMVVIPREKISLFVDKAHELTRYGDMLEFMLLTGLRESEAIGLSFSRYNKEEQTILIDRQIPSRTTEFAPPKHDVIRKVSIPDRCVEIIENSTSTTELIFEGDKTPIVNHHTLYKACKRVGKEIGMPELRLHDLRHTYATYAHASGMPTKTLQTQLGHATASFTLQRYAHSTPEISREYTKTFENFLNGISS